MKHLYTTPDVRIVHVEDADIFTASQNEDSGGIQPDFFDWD